MKAEELLTVQEAAEEANITEAGIRNAIHRGKLPTVHKYGRMLIPRSAFDAYRRTVKPGRPPKQEQRTV